MKKDIKVRAQLEDQHIQANHMSNQIWKKKMIHILRIYLRRTNDFIRIKSTLYSFNERMVHI